MVLYDKIATHASTNNINLQLIYTQHSMRHSNELSITDHHYPNYCMSSYIIIYLFWELFLYYTINNKKYRIRFPARLRIGKIWDLESDTKYFLHFLYLETL